jgi:hypothetical protein
MTGPVAMVGYFGCVALGGGAGGWEGASIALLGALAVAVAAHMRGMAQGREAERRAAGIRETVYRSCRR